jgi:aspartyl protease family protein
MAVRRLLWILLALLTAVLFVLIGRSDAPMAGLARLDLSSLVVKIAAVVFVGALVLAMFRERFSRALESALIWVAIALLGAVGYTFRLELREVADRVLAELVPGHAAARVIELTRAGAGNFPVTARINGGHTAMMLDTGASSVVLTQEAAKAAGLPLEVLSYTVTIDTANGRTRAAPVTLDRIGIGGIEERAVPALVAQPGQLRTNLLGMSFLNRLESWEVRGDRLIMRGYP